MASQVLGYVSAITPAELEANPHGGYSEASQYGQTGLENEYEPYLKGTPGTRVLTVNAQGQVIGTVRQRLPVQGDTVVTNLDLGLQEAAQNALQSDILADRKTPDATTGRDPAATDGALVVMNARTGAVLAMASYPTYDLSEWSGGISEADTPRCRRSAPVPARAARWTTTPSRGCTPRGPPSSWRLRRPPCRPASSAPTPRSTTPAASPCPTAGRTAGCTFHDDEASDAGAIDLPLALTESDDYYFYNLGYLFYVDQSRYGPSPIQNVAHEYGLGDLTGIDLPGEVQGQVDSQAEREALHKMDPTAFPNTTWYVGDNIEMAFGQAGTVVTPVEEADAYATFANGGTRYQPQVAAAIVSPDGELLKQFAPKVTGTVSLPPAVEQPIMQGLLGVVNSPSGTAYGTFQQDAHFPLSKYPVGGKTGTADVGAGQEPNAWFVGFGPTNAARASPSTWWRPWWARVATGPRRPPRRSPPSSTTSTRTPWARWSCPRDPRYLRPRRPRRWRRRAPAPARPPRCPRPSTRPPPAPRPRSPGEPDDPAHRLLEVGVVELGPRGQDHLGVTADRPAQDGRVGGGGVPDGLPDDVGLGPHRIGEHLAVELAHLNGQFVVGRTVQPDRIGRLHPRGDESGLDDDHPDPEVPQLVVERLAQGLQCEFGRGVHTAERRG